MSKKILTIIVPMYNMEKYIAPCLDSLIISGMEQLEVIVVNDCSKDNSLAIARTYESHYPQTFRVIDKENGNYGSCINCGLSKATGQYIRVLDADDFLESKNLDDFLEFLAMVDVDMVFSDYCHVDSQGNKIKHISFRRLSPNVIYGTKDLSCHRFYVFIHSVTYRTDVLRQIDYQQTEGISYTDQEWVFYPMANVKCWRYWPRVNYNYRLGRDGQSVSREAKIRLISHEIEGMLVNVRQYEKAKGQLNADAIAYMQLRLLERAKVIYKSFLLFYYSDLLPSYNLLKDMDVNIFTTSPEVYELTNKLRYHIGPFPYYYVKKWRLSGCNAELWGLRFRRHRDAR